MCSVLESLVGERSVCLGWTWHLVFGQHKCFYPQALDSKEDCAKARHCLERIGDRVVNGAVEVYFGVRPSPRSGEDRLEGKGPRY